MTVEQLLILKWFIIPAVVIAVAIPTVFIVAYVQEYRERKKRREGKR